MGKSARTIFPPHRREFHLNSSRFTAPASRLNLNISGSDELFRELSDRKSLPRPQPVSCPHVVRSRRTGGNCCFIGIGSITKSSGVVLRTNKMARDGPRSLAKLISARLRFHSEMLTRRARLYESRAHRRILRDSILGRHPSERGISIANRIGMLRAS